MLDAITGFFTGESFFGASGITWDYFMRMATKILLKNPTTGTYKQTWNTVVSIYNTLNIIAVSLFCLFFIYGFLRDSCDIHSEMTLDRTIKLFIRLIVCSNVLSLTLTYMPKIITWGRDLTSVIIGENLKTTVFQFDGNAIYERITDSNMGTLVAFVFGMLFFLFICICGFIVVLTVLNRMLKIYMIAPFAGVALSTLAAGGATSQVGYSYIKTFLGYVFSSLLIAVVLLITPYYIQTFSIDSKYAIIILLECCLKIGAVTSAVKLTDNMMTKAFGL